MKYRLMIVAATVIWGSTFVLVKDMTSFINPAWIICLRFTAAALILAAVFAKKRALYLDRSHVLVGLLCGVALGLAYYVQTVAITDTTPGKNAFLTSTYCVMVPFMAWIAFRRRPNRYNIVAALLAIAGVGFISLDGDLTVRWGDAMTLVCAVLYGIHITLVSKFAQGRDICVITIWQFAMAAALTWVIALGFEPAPNWADIPMEIWASIGYLAVFATTIALLFQNIGQAHLPPSSAALLLSLESVFGVLFSVAFGAETITARVLIGFCLVFAAIVVSEVLPERTKGAARE